MRLLLLSLLVLVVELELQLVHGHNILDFGAIPGNTSIAAARMNGFALYQAVQAAHRSSSADGGAGDRTAVVPSNMEFTMVPYDTMEGLYNVTIQLDGVLNAFPGDPTLWPNVTGTGSAKNFIQISRSSHVHLTSASRNGTINGNGLQWWWRNILGNNQQRPFLVVMDSCIQTLMEDWTLYNSPNEHVVWNSALHGLIQRVVVHVDVDGQRDILNRTGHLTAAGIPTFPLNTDGIDISGHNVTVRHCRVQNFDDALCAKPSNRWMNLSTCTTDLVFEDSEITFGGGASVGSVPPSLGVNCVANVTFRRIHFNYPLKGIYVKPNPCNDPKKDGTGIIDNILYEDITAESPMWWSIYVGTQQQDQSGANTGCSFFYPLNGTKCPTQGCVPVTNLKLRNVFMKNAWLSPGLLRCNSSGPCTGWEWTNVTVDSRNTWPVGSNHFLCHAIDGYQFTNVTPGCTSHVTNNIGGPNTDYDAQEKKFFGQWGAAATSE